MGEKSVSKWNELVSTHFQVIYPQGLDSLGLRYSMILERNYPLLRNTTGYYPNQQSGYPLPIVLHPYTAITNGLTGTAPNRIEVFTFSDPYSYLPPLSWETLLSIHEGRHASQFQFAASGFWKFFPNIFGEAAPLVVQGLYLNVAVAEGDGVVAETALTNSGRGRTADFLSYYRMAFDNGDRRNWYRWRYGSQRHYTPDFYRIGYMTVAGARYVYDAPMFMSTYLEKSLNPFNFNALSSTLRRYSRKNLDLTWSEIADTFATIWAADDARRGPFQELDMLVNDKSRFYTVYRGTVETAGGHLLSIRQAMDKTTELVEIDNDGRVKSLRPFNADSKLAYSPVTDCIYWSEAVSDVRWEMYGTSRIRMLKVGDRNISDFTKEGRYVNPAVSADGKFLAAVEYPVLEGCRIVLFSLEDGSVIKTVKGLPGIQMNEVAFSGDNVVFTGVSDAGVGLYMTDFKSVRILEEPAHFKVRDLISKDGVIYFTSDKNGTDEIYSYTVDGVMKQLTNTKYGVSSPFFRNGRLCFTALVTDGRLLAGATNPVNNGVSYRDTYSYPIADVLTRQEQKAVSRNSPYSMFSPGRYSNGIRIHSWIPYYINNSGLTGSMTGYAYEYASLGCVGYLQNLPTTLYGSIGLSLHPDPFDETEMKAGIHARLNYTGLFPVFSLTFDAGDRVSAKTVRGISPDDTIRTVSVKGDGSSPFFLGGSLTVSLPLNFSSGGWNRSLTPFAGILTSTDQLGDGYRNIQYNESVKDYEPVDPVYSGLYPTTRLVAGFSGAVELPIASSAIYPRLGIGGGMQYSRNSFANSLYASVYGYLPGLTRVHGLKLSASMQQKKLNIGSTLSDVWAFDMYDMAPRGYFKTDVESLLKLYFLDTYKVSAEYAMPVLPMDLSLKQYVYLRNLELHPFFDYMIAQSNGKTETLMSAGTDLVFRFEKLLIYSNTAKIGVRFAYNSGSLNKYVSDSSPFIVGVVTGIDF
ncbi:MAG: PD40 domain-containing protein [Bacteroidaceae bacterium]|nr:PD40 domain-containing protein [Bacteroidaceae bacterium]